MIMLKTVGLPFVAAILFAVGCGGDSPESATSAADAADHGHAHEEGTHGGLVVSTQDGKAHVEVAHDQAQGRIDLYILDEDSSTSLPIADAPRINLKTANGPVQIQTIPVGAAGTASQFGATNRAFESDHLEGQLVLLAHGKQYLVTLPEHDHAAGHTHAQNAVSFTAWTAACEWFVELEMPEAGKPAEFAAHVTLLDQFRPATAGTFSVEATANGQTASTRSAAPARPGIFTPSITFPAAGEWTVRLTFQESGLTDVVAWTLQVHEPGQAPGPEDAPAGVISFLKEQQWKIPFNTAAVSLQDVGEKKNVIAVPLGALLGDAGDRTICIQLEGEAFAVRKVTTGVEADGMVEVVSGLTEGERVVTEGMGAVLK